MIWLLNLIDAIRYRRIHGHWCPHPRYTRWTLHDLGRRKHRVCLHCGRWEWA